MISYLKHPGTEQNFCLGMSTAQSTEIKIFPDYVKPHLKPTTKSLFQQEEENLNLFFTRRGLSQYCCKVSYNILIVILLSNVFCTVLLRHLVK